MTHRLLKYACFCLLIICTVSGHAQEDGGRKLRAKRKNARVKTRLSVSPVIGLYKTNAHHTSSPRQKMAFCGSLKEEIRLDKQNKCFLMVGAEYMLHGLSFNSYYFYPDSIQLYNGHMDYRYSLLIHELDFPLQLKYSFRRENNSIWSHYIFAGYCYRWLVASDLQVTQSGQEVDFQHEKLKFKNPAFNPVNNAFMNVGLGMQKNTPMKQNAFFVELQFRYGLSPFYFNESFAPSSMYISGSHIFLTLGLKF
ncbi:MAG: outer membrane beta-barrel protein [Bacteroidetes bacterium]|nr:outer membrane beta-barrel protein [Bacteroidota bacterium]